MALARVVTRLSLPITLLLGLILATASPVAAAADLTEFQQVRHTAMSKLDARWVHYARGPQTFDCVGFVWYAFKENELASKIGYYRGVRGYYKWFKTRGLAAGPSAAAKPGDLIIWGDFKHIGIYLGDGKAISALSNPYGVSVHPVKGYIRMKVKAILHTRLEH